jgi:hypothetical protein
VEKSAGLAISGPNLLEISFPASYFLSSQYCERPEVTGQLVTAASQVAGRAIDVSIRLLPASSAADRSEPGGPSAAPKRRKASLEKDPFVSQALSVFGGTLVDVREIPRVASEE